MRTQHTENGGLIVTQGSKHTYVILGILAFLLLSKDAFLWVFSAEHNQGKQFLAITVIVLTILFFYRVWSLNSEFTFNSIEKNLSYYIQYPFFNKKGVIPLIQIEKAVIDTDNDGGTRVVIVCSNEKIPMSARVLPVEEFGSICNDINRWLKDNKI